MSFLANNCSRLAHVSSAQIHANESVSCRTRGSFCSRNGDVLSASFISLDLLLLVNSADNVLINTEPWVGPVMKTLLAKN